MTFLERNCSDVCKEVKCGPRELLEYKKTLQTVFRLASAIFMRNNMKKFSYLLKNQ